MAALRVLSALVLKPALADLASAFERAQDRALAIGYDAAGRLKNRIAGGEVCDVAIIQRSALEGLARERKIAQDSIAVLARSGLAVAVREDAPKPKVDSAEALARTLLAARSVAYPDPAVGHASGVHFQAVIERLKIAQAVTVKAKLFDGTLAEFAAADEAEIAVTQPPEILAAPGYELAGWLPSELQNDEMFTWAAGASTGSKEPDAAAALVRFLASPTAASVFENCGMAPGTR
jgi:molybdate transport system substrate-binding protein